jgi:hypothetical protein
MMKSVFVSAAASLSMLIAGCANYEWGSPVPQEFRTVAVPVFENSTPVSELGPIVTQYTLREFQRNGTFKISRVGDAAVEVQGVLKKASRGALSYDRSSEMRATEYRYTVCADVTFVDKKNGNVLLECRNLKAETSFLVSDDLLTGQRNAAARIADDLAKQIVNEALSIRYNGSGKGSGAVEGVQK